MCAALPGIRTGLQNKPCASVANKAEIIIEDLKDTAVFWRLSCLDDKHPHHYPEPSSLPAAISCHCACKAERASISTSALAAVNVSFIRYLGFSAAVRLCILLTGTEAPLVCLVCEIFGSNREETSARQAICQLFCDS